MTQGYIHVYTGNGKGKTTAGFGLALRAACAGKRVYIGQFVKDAKYSETRVVEYLPSIEIEQLGKGCFIDRKPTDEDRKYAREGLLKCRDMMHRGTHHVYILDELTIAQYFGLLTESDIIEALKYKASHVEVVITGRYATDGILALADLVTEMVEVKHYYSKGVLSRTGIDC